MAVYLADSSQVESLAQETLLCVYTFYACQSKSPMGQFATTGEISSAGQIRQHSVTMPKHQYQAVIDIFLTEKSKTMLGPNRDSNAGPMDL